MRELPIANCRLLIVAAYICASIAIAQESPTPTSTLEESAAASPTLTPPASPSASAVTARNVPLRFVPPPMEGTISLGIWDSNDKLVRVLHREAKIDNFTVEENSLSTTWDGKNDAGEDLPVGKYRARGFLVGKMKVEDLGKPEAAPADTTDRIAVKLVTNPLISDTRAIMEIGAGFDDKGSFLKTMDGLPLATISPTSHLRRVSIRKDGEKSADVWQVDDSQMQGFRVSNVDKIMAFDCGFFELK